ncbi:MAG TPA: hypothetical protein VFU07_10350 [Candidatus Lumbricidophila sp.]|nr:hypothetical protein [Candidatus Lumbricidophila sp.]
MNEQPKRAVRVIDACSFVACILLAIIAGVATVVSGSPSYQQGTNRAVPLLESLAEASVRALAIGVPLTLLLGLPVFYWLYSSAQPAVRSVVLLGVIGALPGIVLLFVGLATRNELVFIGIYLVVGGAWSGVLGATLFCFLRRVPAVPIALAALLIGAGVAGAMLAR